MVGFESFFQFAMYFWNPKKNWWLVYIDVSPFFLGGGIFQVNQPLVFGSVSPKM